MSMYNLLEYSSNYSDTTGSLQFYSKDKADEFGKVIVNTNAFKFFKYNTKLTRSPPATNGILEDAKIAAKSKHLINFRRSRQS